MDEPARYWAFLSYSHKDRQFARWLHRALESYAIPSALVGTIGANGEIPKKLAPIFRDREELAASANLGDRLKESITQSRFLIVVCSPDAAASRWTNEEIATFKRAHGADRILAAIISGEPNATDMPGREGEECFPPALRYQMAEDGTLTGNPAEPIAADFRVEGDGKRLAKLKLIAGMLGVPLDTLVQREAQRRNRRLAWLSAASVAGMAVTSGLAIAAIQARDEARFQRGEAAGMVEYMLTDLRKKLEPVGRLDVLDGVGQRALAYYEKQDVADLSPDELAQRAAALNLVGEMRNLKGDLANALVAFREAARTTKEQLRREPESGQRMFDHSQSSFWVGYIAWQRGDRITARRYFADYLAMAKAMVAADPNNVDWRAETGHANINLGVLDKEEAKYPAALAHFQDAEAVWRKVARSKPKDREVQYNLAQSLAWQADTYRSAGRLDQAVAARSAEADIFNRLLANDDQDFDAVSGKLVSDTAKAKLLVDQGHVRQAANLFARLQPSAERLMARDSSNTLWREQIAGYWNGRTVASLALGNAADADRASQMAIQQCEWLVAKDNSVEAWQTDCLAGSMWRAASAARLRNDQAAAAQWRRRFGARFPPGKTDVAHEVRMGRLYFLAVEHGVSAAARAVPILNATKASRSADIEAAQEYFQPDGVRVGAFPFAAIVDPN